MNTVILEGPQGRREVISGIRYHLLPGERVIDSGEGGADNHDNKKLQEMANAQGMGVGDLVAKLTKVFGIKPCASCEQRRRVLNKLRINNWKITKEK